ncbi:MAG TPA: nicotinate (nicotinamide) nucleotide adenylyltransferase [Myxococcales bacterium]|nr:nicotinate (nicotinamide) nucleotide adenylyltransferase [Myxococcales bacterium]
MRIALLGGSFNPPHLGHVLATAQVLSLREPDELWWVPALRHPFGKALAPYEARVAMAALAIAPLGPRVKVSRAEAEAPSARGTTVELLRHLIAAHPGHRFLWIAGADILLERDRWESFDEVTRLAELVVVNRAGFPETPGAGAPLSAISSTEIRERLARGESVEGLVPAAVGRYLREHSTYR